MGLHIPFVVGNGGESRSYNDDDEHTGIPEPEQKRPIVPIGVVVVDHNRARGAGIASET